MWEVGDDECVRRTTVLVKNDEVGDIVCTTSSSKFFDDIGTAVDTCGVWEDKTHFLRKKRFIGMLKQAVKVGLTFANCKSLELGSLDVVITIFGSIIPAFAYSSSTCVPGSNKPHRFSSPPFST